MLLGRIFDLIGGLLSALGGNLSDTASGGF